MKNFYSRLLYATIITAILYAIFYFYIDRPVAYMMQPLANTIYFKIGYVMMWIGKPAIWAILALIGVIFYLTTGGYKKQNRALDSLFLICASLVLSSVLNTILKDLLARYRPIELFQYGYYGFHFLATAWALNSTPSGHATVAFTFASSLSFLYRRWCGIFYILAILMAVSRIVMDHHYVSDVIFGAYIGIISTMIIRHMFAKKLTILTNIVD